MVLDMAEAKWLEKEQKGRDNAARMFTQQQEKEKWERLEKDWQKIQATVKEDKEGSKSTAEGHSISLSLNIFTAFYTYFNKQLCQDTGKKKIRCEFKEDACKKAPQTSHSEVGVPL